MQDEIALIPLSFIKIHHLNDFFDFIESKMKSLIENHPHIKLFLFPEYGSLSLNALFPNDLNQVKECNRKLLTLIPEFRKFFLECARKYRVYILAPSIPYFENHRYVNRAFFYSPDGKEDYQDKVMMTRFEDEEWGIQSGGELLKIFATSIGKVSILTCFDIEFPQHSLALSCENVDLILVPSCTDSFAGMERVHRGAKARAQELQTQVAVVQTIKDALWNPAVDSNIGQSAIYLIPDTSTELNRHF